MQDVFFRNSPARPAAARAALEGTAGVREAVDHRLPPAMQDIFIRNSPAGPRGGQGAILKEPSGLTKP